MEIYNKLDFEIDKLYEKLNKNDMVKEYIKTLNYPLDLIVIIIKDPKLLKALLKKQKNIVDILCKNISLYSDIINFINKIYDLNYSQLLELELNIESFNKINSNRKLIYKSEIVLINYLIEQKFYKKYYQEINLNNVKIDKNLDIIKKLDEEIEDLSDFENLEIKKIDQNEVAEYKFNNLNQIKKYEFRENQQEAFKLLELNGIETGIHCQATGCGKTYIILKYCDYFVKKKYLGNIIIFTERVNILADLFNFTGDLVDSDNKFFWNSIGLIDLDMFNIYNRVTIKKNDWDDLLKNKSDKPNILVINRSYLTRPEMYNTFTNKHIGMVLHDECHSSTSNLCHKFLKYCKDQNINIIGFSATPLRTTNSSKTSKLNKDKLLEIYSDGSNELKLLTNYNMIYAISKKLILSPTFNWYSIKFNQELTKLNRYDINNDHVGSIIKILEEILDKLPNKKILAWAGTISFAEKWKVKLDEEIKKSLILKNIHIYIDHSKSQTDINSKTDYDKFKESDGLSMLICANKHREGSDIKKLDCCIFLDRCKTRSPIPFIQSIGRVLRVDSNCKEKTTGMIIDGFIDTCDEYAKFIIDKIYGYYLALENVSGNSLDDTKEEKYIKLMEMIDFDSTNKKIKLKGLNLEINSNQINWKDISKKFDIILNTKLTQEKINKYEFKKLKKKIKKMNFIFKQEYLAYAKKYELEENPDIKYKNIWKGWYDFFGIDINIFPTDIKSWGKLCLQNEITWINYYDKIIYYKNIPEFPNEIYDKFTNLKSELELLTYNEIVQFF